MRLDNLIVRLSALLGPEWLQAYALVDLQPGVDIDKLRLQIPSRLKFHHETEKYLGGVPGDLFIGFFAQGHEALFQETSRIKAMTEIRGITRWGIANFPVNKPELRRLDWQIMKCLRADANKSIGIMAEEIGVPPPEVEARLHFLKELPAALSIEPPNQDAWEFVEIHYDFEGTTFSERLADLAQIGKPFGVTSDRLQGAIMVEPTDIDQLKQQIKAVNDLAGVTVTGYAFCEDMIWSQPWLDDFIDERIQEFDN